LPEFDIMIYPFANYLSSNLTLKKVAFLFFYIIGILSTSTLSAQKPKDFGIKSKKALTYYLAGKQQLEYRDMVKAMEYFQQAVQLEPTFKQAHFLLVHTADTRNKISEVKNSLEFLANLPDPEMAKSKLIYALFLMNETKYVEAEKYFKAYLSTEPKEGQDKKRAEVNLRKCKYAAVAIKQPLSFIPKNLGTGINGPTDEYMPNLTADGKTLFFTSRRPGNIGGMDPRTHDFDEDFYASKAKPDGSWDTPVNVGGPLNTAGNEGASCFTQDGKEVYFIGCNRKDGFGECDIYVSEFNGNGWNAPRNLGNTVNTAGYETHPWISGDGKTLYFVSTRPGGFGGTDIWYSQKEQGEWATPVNLGAGLNSPGNEYNPFLHASDQALYFSSDWWDGFGDFDLFMTLRTENSWGKITNLGYPLNTPSIERFLFITSDGKTGYMSSDRIENGWGRNDLFRFDIPASIRPPAATWVSGKIVEEIDQSPVKAKITLIDLGSGDTVRQVNSDPIKGEFLLSLPFEKEYAVYIEEPGYLFASRNFSLIGASTEKPFELNISLQPIQEGSSIVLRNVFFETNQFALLPTSHSELNKLILLLQKNTSLVVEIAGHTDNQGGEAYNLTLSQNRSNSVKQYLVSAGIPEKRIVARGYGETKPIADNTTEEGRALNRRTEFIILKR